ncbi:MAG TPA: hypothetical protein VLS25_10185 [Dehalococcoidia bacterium]|nr:hypothetical protein [Dehalococcoidia bacterium]
MSVVSLFAIGRRGPTGDNWTWETPPKPAGGLPPGGPLLPIATALAVGMLVGVTAMASLSHGGNPNQLAVLEPSPAASRNGQPGQAPARRTPTGSPAATGNATPGPTGGPHVPVVFVRPGVLSESRGGALARADIVLTPAPLVPGGPHTSPGATRTARPTATPNGATPPGSTPPGPTPTATPTPWPTYRPRITPTPTAQPTVPPVLIVPETPTPTPTPTPAPPPPPPVVTTPGPVFHGEAKVSGGGQADGGQFSVNVDANGEEEIGGHFNYHGSQLRIESDRITSVALAGGPCGPDSRAVVTGFGTVNGAGHTAFEITADDCGEPGNWHGRGSDHLGVVAGGVTVDGDVSGNIQIDG